MKKIPIIMIFMLCLNLVNGQGRWRKFDKNEFEISGFGGMSGIKGAISDGAITPTISYQTSFEWKHFFSQKWGIGTGIQYASYNSTSQLSNYYSATPAVDDLGESFEYRVTASGIRENVKISAVEAPLFLAYRNVITKKQQFQASLGVKFSYPISASYRSTAGTVETRGYYPAYAVEFFNLPNHGFEKVDPISYSGKLISDLSVSIMAGFGFSLAVSKNCGISIGVYGSYGLLSPVKPGEKQLVNYPVTYNSTFSVAKNLVFVDTGLKCGFRF